MDPWNYGWYQCRFHVAAAEVFDRAGPGAARRLWDTFLPRTVAGIALAVNDDELLPLLHSADPAFGDFRRRW
jgi:hypothetical protein